MMRITGLIGAGAVLEIGGPTSADLTRVIRQKKQVTGLSTGSHHEIAFLEDLTRQVEDYYSPEAINFEDVFHAIEVLYSLELGFHTHTAKRFKPALGGFVQPIDPRFFDASLLRQAGESIVEGVAGTVAAYMAAFEPDGKHAWFADFWRAGGKRGAWDLATLNYDDSIERSLLPGTWDDGFEEPSSGHPGRFNPLKLDQATGSRVFHEHGCVLYGYPHDPNLFPFEDQHEDLYKYMTYDSARESWFGRSNNQAQSGEQAIIGPIITGLRKPDKLLAFPYSAYHAAFQKAVIENSRLLVVGYSFGDIHFNRVLERITRLHDKDRRIVLIAYCPDPNSWHPDPMFHDWLSHEQFTFIAKAFRDCRPLGTSFSMPDPLISVDGCARVYLHGFRRAIEDHGDEILEFLTS